MKTDDKILFHRNLLTYQRYIEYNVLKDPLDSPPFLQIFKSFMKIFVISVTKNRKQNNIWSSYSVVVFRLLSVYYHFIFALSISFCNILKFSFYFLSFIIYTDNYGALTSLINCKYMFDSSDLFFDPYYSIPKYVPRRQTAQTLSCTILPKTDPPSGAVRFYFTVFCFIVFRFISPGCS